MTTVPLLFIDALIGEKAQWLAFGFNFVYVLLATRGNPLCWFFGLLGTIFQFWVCLDADLRSDAILQVYYMGSAVYGWHSWQQQSADRPALDGVQRLPWARHGQIALLGIAIAFPLGYLWPSAAFRYEDALLAVFSVATTFLTTRKYIESWLYWFVIDGSYALIYYQRDKYLLAILSLIYLIFSIRGYLVWQKALKST